MNTGSKEPEMVALPFEALLIAFAGKGKTIGPEARHSYVNV